MKSLLVGLFAGLLLAISAIAEEKPADSWFVALDNNRDGGISLRELQAMRYERFLVIDVNGDGEISAAEVAASPSWTARFQRMDTNADGRLTLIEFEATGRGRFEIIDIDGDGRITPHEALNFQRKVRKYGPETTTTG
ncbi:MAG: hypothetical protein HQ483_05540 [Rhodospirillales bacterium]|nr:hypothetical protein [Rhodospirillales bacterium]